MDEQVAARLRLIEARLDALEMAVRPKPICRTRTGRPRRPEPWTPGDEQPLTDWLALRLTAVEHVLGFVLRADELRTEEADAPMSLAEIVDDDLIDLEIQLTLTKANPADFGDLLFRALVRQMRIVLDDQSVAPEAGEEEEP